MAITKIHAIRSTIQKSINYICNPHKTDNRILVDSFGCGIYTAGNDFFADNSKSKGKSTSVPAYHLIQSFAPGEVTFEEAHNIGLEFAKNLLEDKRAYVLATHVDRNHVHNHIIFCSTDFVDNHRFNDNRAAYYNIRKLSDTLCKEHNLSVIIPGPEKGKSYSEWEAEKKNDSYKLILKRDIFDCIRYSTDYEDFLSRMKQRGYEIKGAEFGEDAPKYISFKPEGYGNFIRGCKKNLGKGHTKEEIMERIERQIASREAWKEKQKTLPLYTQKLVDTSTEKYQENEAFKHWADLRNLQIAASSYANTGSISELNIEIDLLKDKLKQNRSSLVVLDKEKKELAEQIRYLSIYNENKVFFDEYNSAKDPDDYLMRNESRLTLYDGAVSVLEKYNINPDNVSLEQLKKDLDNLEETRNRIKNENDLLIPKIKELQLQLNNLNDYLQFNKSKEVKDTQKGQEH